MPISSVITPISNWKKKSNFPKLHKTTIIPLVFLIQNFSSFYFLLKKWWSFDYFFFFASEALKIFWGPQKRPNFLILDLWICLKKLGLEPDIYGKSVLYLRETPTIRYKAPGQSQIKVYLVHWIWLTVCDFLYCYFRTTAVNQFFFFFLLAEVHWEMVSKIICRLLFLGS